MNNTPSKRLPLVTASEEACMLKPEDAFETVKFLPVPPQSRETTLLFAIIDVLKESNLTDEQQERIDRALTNYTNNMVSCRYPLVTNQ